MSDKGDKTCPLCAEEMDLTDQQLKPCKCGYEICVWCWHHIMDMAEKDDTEGRCPACRTPYNKEKIVGMTANCERVVAEMNVGRKQKTQKGKNKTSEGRKQLSNVRVIQRNLVYIVGLPLNLADEDLLQHKEYFGQYGKVLKVSISRTAAGAIQQSSTNTCSVYITYSNKEEAVRCIQCVHGFVLEDKCLRACFGTTKYCHAWLRNMPCSNPDCLYLHEFGSQEDSFSKDEIVSAHTRSRVQLITGATYDMQRRSGNVLPPPPEECSNNISGSSGKPISRSPVNNISGSCRGSPPNSSDDRSVSLPTAASWGIRGSNSLPLDSSLHCSDGPNKEKPDICAAPIAFSTAVSSSNHFSTLQSDVGKKPIPIEEGSTIHHNGRSESLEHSKQHISTASQVSASRDSVKQGVSSTSTMDSQLYFPPASKDIDITSSFDLVRPACDSGAEYELDTSVNGSIQSLCSNISSLTINGHLGVENFDGITPNCSITGPTLIKSPKNQGLQQSYEQYTENPPSLRAVKSEISTDDICVSRAQFDSQIRKSAFQVEENMLSFDDQRLKDPEDVSCANLLPNFSQSSDISRHSMVNSTRRSEAYVSNNLNRDPQYLDKNVEELLLQHSSGVSLLSNGYSENLSSGFADQKNLCNDSLLLLNEGKGKHMGRFDGRFKGEEASINQNGVADMGESSIISNILSMDLDPWDESLTSPQNLARLLGKTDKQHESLKVSSLWKVQNSNQSKFSFARQEEPKSQIFDDQPYFSNVHVPKNPSRYQDIVESRDSYFYRPGHHNGLSSLNVDRGDSFGSSNYQDYSNKSTITRSQISAPPGFSGPSRAPPPGFTSQERVEHTYDNTMSGNHLHDNSFLLRNPYQAPPTGSYGSTGDIELMDPAILAVGKGSIPVGLNHNAGFDVRSSYPTDFSAFENEARLQLLLQRSFPSNQNLRYSDVGDGLPLNDAYGIPTRHLGIMEQSPTRNISQLSQLSLQQQQQQSRSPLMSNGHWNGGWSEIPNSNELGMAELLRTERLGFNKIYNDYHDSKFRMPSSGDIYNRTFGI